MRWVDERESERERERKSGLIQTVATPTKLLIMNRFFKPKLFLKFLIDLAICLSLTLDFKLGHGVFCLSTLTVDHSSVAGMGAFKIYSS